MRKEYYLFILAVLFLLSGSTTATVYYVSAGALNGNGTIIAPYGTISQAFAVAVSGDTILVEPGTYNGGNWAFYGKIGLIVQSTGGKAVTFINPGNLQTFKFSTGDVGTVDGFTFTGAAHFALIPNFGGSATIQNCDFLYNNPIAPALTLDSAATTTVINVSYNYNAASFAQVTSGTLNVQNSFFLLNTPTTPLISIAAGSVVVTGSTFISNPGVIVINSLTAPVSFDTCNFFNNTAATFNCGSTVDLLTITNSVTCGVNNGLSGCPAITIPATFADACGICGGNGQNKNCVGVCFQPNPQPCPASNTWYVSPGATGDGTTNTTPIGTIQAAVNAAGWSDTIILGPGTYTGTGNVAVNFGGKALKVISSSLTPTCVVIDCQYTPNMAFIANLGEDTRTTLSGVTIQNCRGGGVVISAGSALTIANSVIKGSRGGAIINGVGNIQNCIFQDNTNTAASGGGGVVSVGSFVTPSSITISGTSFLRNTAYGGGAISVGTSGTATISLTNNIFISNDVLYATPGGAILFALNAKVPVMTGNQFYQNGATASVGGAFACSIGAVVTFGNGNGFCGNNGNSISCAVVPSQSLSNYDNCSVCNGNFQQADCTGTCFGLQVFDVGGCGVCQQLSLGGGSGHPVVITSGAAVSGGLGTGDGGANVIGAAVGGAIGGLAFIALVVIITIVVVRKRQLAKKELL